MECEVDRRTDSVLMVTWSSHSR